MKTYFSQFFNEPKIEKLFIVFLNDQYFTIVFFIKNVEMKELVILPGDSFDGFVQLFTTKGRGKISRYITAEGKTISG